MPVVPLLTFLLMPSMFSDLPSSTDLIFGGKKKSDVYKSGEYEDNFIVESSVLPKSVIIILHCESSHLMQEKLASLFQKQRLYPTDSFNQTRHYFHIIFLIHCLTWKEILYEKSLTIEESNQCHFGFSFEIKNSYGLESLASAMPGADTVTTTHQQDRSAHNTWDG
jgi:hypothetical protein